MDERHVTGIWRMQLAATLLCHNSPENHVSSLIAGEDLLFLKRLESGRDGDKVLVDLRKIHQLIVVVGAVWNKTEAPSVLVAVQESHYSLHTVKTTLQTSLIHVKPTRACASLVQSLRMPREEYVAPVH